MNLNPNQRKVLLAYASIVFLLCTIFLPWARNGSVEDITIREFCSYSPVWKVPDPDGMASGIIGCSIDMQHLFIEILSATILAGIIFYLTRTKANL